MTRDIVLRDGTVMTPDGPLQTSVHIRAGRVAAMGQIAPTDGTEEVDCTGCWVGPGFVDLHVHLRQPGQEYKEDIASGSAAAAAGGFTAVVAMPNTIPAVDSPALVRLVRAEGAAAGLVDVAPAAAITSGRNGRELSALEDLCDAGVRIFSDDGDSVGDAGLLRSAMERLAVLGGVISQHAVDGGLSRGRHLHEGAVSARLGIPGVPAVAEEIAVARDLALVRLTGAAYHLQHAATAGVLQMVAEARAAGLPVTVEVTPHHLMFDETAVADADPRFKMMPPLRTGADRKALREGVRSGLVDAIATDHAPHAAHEKRVPFEEAAFGVTGLEWAAAVVRSTTGLGPRELFERMAVRPAEIAGLPEHGRWVEPDAPANLVVFDPDQQWTPTTTLSKSDNSPYFGVELTGFVRATVLRGRITARNGSIHTGEKV